MMIEALKVLREGGARRKGPLRCSEKAFMFENLCWIGEGGK